MTTRRATKPQTSTNKAKEAPIHGPGSGGRDRRTAQEYAADLARETERSLRRDPERWTQRRTNEIPKDEAPSPRRHDLAAGAAAGAGARNRGRGHTAGAGKSGAGQHDPEGAQSGR